METWAIKPTNSPSIIRTCSKCGNGSRFLCSGNFRINANGRNIDVWLIYKCSQCETTWNMKILSRVKPQQIQPQFYQAFLRNDMDTAQKYAFDTQTLAQNNAVVCYDDVQYKIEKTTCVGDCDLTILSSFDLSLRLDKLLSDELALSRTRVKALIENGDIKGVSMTLTAKTKIKGTIKLKGDIINGESFYKEKNS